MASDSVHRTPHATTSGQASGPSQGQRPGQGWTPSGSASPAAPIAASPEFAPAGAITLPTPTKLRRRPAYLAAGILCVALGALLAVWLFTASRASQGVLAVREPVSRGEVIEAGDLMSVSISLDPALRPVPASAMPEVIGRRASIDLAAGSLLTQGSFTDTVIPAPGTSLVGVWLAPGQLPGQELQSGDPVRIVLTPKQDDDLSASTGVPIIVRAQVVSATASDDGHTLVTVVVPSPSAPQLAQLVATGRVALLLDSTAR